LRSAEFTQKYGLTPSIMDYARVNYVAQPGDEGVKYIRMMGPYDLYAINWGYRYLPDAKSPEEEKTTLDRWVKEKSGDPVFQFGSGYGNFDPQSQRESLGRDQVKASEYGLANLKKVVPNLVAWTTKDGDGYEDLEEVYKELNGLWRGYINHVVANVGGVYETRKTADQDGVVYEPVPKEKQVKAVNFLNEHAFTTPHWLLDQEILDRIEATGAVERIQKLQSRALSSLLEEDRLQRMVENEQVRPKEAYTALELMKDLRSGIFAELYRSSEVDVFRRNLQRSYVDVATEYLQKLQQEKREAVTTTDVMAIMRGEMEDLKNDIERRKGRSRDKLTLYHWNDLLARIKAGIEPEA
jgi:hypothetical protein